MKKDFKPCMNCRGTKTIIGLGMFTLDCPTCKGVGYIDNEEKEHKEVVVEPLPEKEESSIYNTIEIKNDFLDSITRRGRGRPPKRK